MTAKKILIADDDRDLVRSLAIRCEALGLQVITAHDCLSAITLAQSESPDVLCLDVDMPGGTGLNVCEMLTTDPRWLAVPIIVLTGRHNAMTLYRCELLSAHYVLKDGDIWAKIGPLLTSLLEQNSTLEQPSPEAETLVTVAGLLGDGLAPTFSHRVLVIDDDADISLALRTRLLPYGVDVLRSLTGMHGFWTAVSEAPDAIIIDMSMPDGGGNYILGRLRNHPRTASIPIIVLTGERNPGQKRQMLSSGATQYLLKPLIFEELLAELRQIFPLSVAPLSENAKVTV
jgi:DNA-binding response OmpR family regulator